MKLPRRRDVLASIGAGAAAVAGAQTRPAGAGANAGATTDAPSSPTPPAGTTAALTAAQTAAPELSAEAARRDLRTLQRALTDLHPGLWRYTTQAQLDAAFAAAEQAVAAGSSRAQMFVLASRLAAAVRCGHTWASRYNQGPAVVAQLFGRADKLPCTLRWVEGRALVTAGMAAGPAAGAELLAIDGRPVAGIAAALLPCLRADGQGPGSDGKRRSQLDSGPTGGAMDRLFPLLFPPERGRYTLTLRPAADPRAAPFTLGVDAVTEADRQRALPPTDLAWDLQVDGDTAVLTLPTFAFWRSDFKPLEFLARTFAAIRRVPFLIIDQRRNEGGDDAIGRALISHLLQAPVQWPGSRVESAYERVPYALARYLDTWDFSFFDRTGQVTRGPGRNWLLPQAPATLGTRIEPAAAPYPGRAVLLVGPVNSSAGFTLARDLQRSGAATLLGQPTGGSLRGLNGGQLAWITLPASGVAVDIPLLASFAAGDPPDAGVLPEVRVNPSFADAAAGVDTEMVAARRLVAGWRSTGAAAVEAVVGAVR